jgi:hypothetical protein
MTKTIQMLIIAALATSAHAGHKETPEQKAATAALLAEYTAAHGVLIITTEPGVTRQLAHDALVQRSLAKGNEIVSDAPYQLVTRIDAAEVMSSGKTFLLGMAGDPAGGQYVIMNTTTFIEVPGEPLRIRFCPRVVQENRAGGTSASSCAAGNFKQWRAAREQALAAFSAEALGVTKESTDTAAN